MDQNVSKCFSTKFVVMLKPHSNPHCSKPRFGKKSEMGPFNQWLSKIHIIWSVSQSVNNILALMLLVFTTRRMVRLAHLALSPVHWIILFVETHRSGSFYLWRHITSRSFYLWRHVADRSFYLWRHTDGGLFYLWLHVALDHSICAETSLVNHFICGITSLVDHSIVATHR